MNEERQSNDCEINLIFQTPGDNSRCRLRFDGFFHLHTSASFNKDICVFNFLLLKPIFCLFRVFKLEKRMMDLLKFISHQDYFFPSQDFLSGQLKPCVLLHCRCPAQPLIQELILCFLVFSKNFQSPVSCCLDLHCTHRV